MDTASGKSTPIVRENVQDDGALNVENESSRVPPRMSGRISEYEAGDTVLMQEETPKKKKKWNSKGIHIPVKAFKSREDRDPEKVNDELKVNFEDVINEPEGFYTAKYSWHLSHELFGFGRSCCYSVFTFFCGVPAAFLWGIVFAFVACINVWCFAPCRRGHIINMSCLGGFWSTCISALCDPFYRSIGLIFSNLHVRTEKFIV